MFSFTHLSADRHERNDTENRRRPSGALDLTVEILAGLFPVLAIGTVVFLFLFGMAQR